MIEKAVIFSERVGDRAGAFKILHLGNLSHSDYEIIPIVWGNVFLGEAERFSSGKGKYFTKDW